MYRYKLSAIYDIIPLEIKIVNEPINEKGFADILSISLETLHKLNRAKNKINEINSFKWEDIKKLTNPYEFIHSFNNTNPTNSNNPTNSTNPTNIALIKPLSRSFFKMIEIIYEFLPNIIDDNDNDNDNDDDDDDDDDDDKKQKFISVHIAEGPGGFIEAVRYVRKGNKTDLAYGMTLVKYDKTEYKNVQVPGWNKSIQFLNNNPEVNILNGADGTGNIYNIENIKYIDNKIRANVGANVGANVVTADGGFDFSVDYNYQEQTSCKLIFSQILCAINCQKNSGSFICKFFDLNLYFTVEMLYLLYTLYETVNIYKPFTSRIANSEKYIVCTNFKGIDKLLLNNLFEVLAQWNKYDKNTINHIFEKIPSDFIDYIKKINNEIVNLQIISINHAINIYKSNKINNDKKWYDSTIKLHIEKAKEWCKKYKIPYT